MPHHCSGYGEYDIANAETPITEPPANAGPGDIGFAPQGKIGNFK